MTASSLDILIVLLVVIISRGDAAQSSSSEGGLVEEGQIILDRFYSRYNATKQVDLVFVLDRSGSVPPSGWRSMMEFVGKILEHFTVDEDNTRVAVITFSTTASVDIDDLPEAAGRRRSETKCTLYARLRQRVEARTPFGYTATSAALRKAHGVLLNARPSAKKAVLMLTDGRSNIGPPPVRASVDVLSLRWDAAWDAAALGPQVEVYAFGVEDAYVPELRSIASKLPGHVFMIPKFSLFADFARSLHGGLQEENWLPTERERCQPICNSTFARCMCGSKVGIYACACDPGYEMIGDTCTACPAGYYKDNSKPEKCSMCPENTTTNHVAAVTKDACHPLAGYQVCSRLPEIANGRKFQVTGSRKDEVLNTGVACDRVKDGNSCHYECDVGYRLSGPPVMICNNTGLWEGDIPSCDAVDCYEVDNTHGDIEGADIHYRDNHTLYQAIASVTCHPGRVPLPNVTTWSCDQHGQWTIPSTFQCAEVFCAPLQLRSFMVVTPAECSTEVQAHGTLCNLSCAEGFEMIGDASKSCSFSSRALWQPETWPRCKDIQDPVITCPENVEVTLPHFEQNRTKIHRSAYQNPVVSDNSWPPGFSNYSIRGLPPDGVFEVGLTVLRYVATDSEGNTASCTQNIHVTEKTVDIRRCPSDIHKVGRSMEVTWDDPIFLGPDGALLPHACTPSSGSMFSGEGNEVACYPQHHPGIQCIFNVTVKPKDCLMPDERPPSRGSVICGENEYLQRVCRIMCEKGYSMKDLSKKQFRCRDDGTWIPELGNWPACSKTGWGRNVLIAQSMHIRYSGSCQDNIETIQEAFKATMRHILTADFGPCADEQLCSVRNVVVMCGELRRRRRATDEAPLGDDDQPKTPRPSRQEAVEDDRRSKRSPGGVTVEFSLSVEYDEAQEMTPDKQTTLLLTLEDVVYNITGMVEARDFGLDIDGVLYTAEAVETLSDVPEFHLNCSFGEIAVISVDNVDDISARCITCAPGSYLDNNDCVLCPYNTYQDEDGQLQCKECPNNKTTMATGAWNISQCKDVCKPGSYSSTGYEPCTLCDKGHYQTNEQQTECTPCPQNTTTPGPGASNSSVCQAPCSSGTYSKTGLEPCTGCPPGTYQPEASSTSCLVCDYLNPTAEMEEWCSEPVNCSESDTACVGGFCVVSQNDYVICRCSKGFHGDACELNIDDCAEDACQNGGLCRDAVNGFRCECPPAYTGTYCEHYRGACASMPCHNNASCVDEGPNFRCVCAEGYNGTSCEREVDPCSSSPCVHGSCSSLDGRPSCQCEAGFAGAYCQKSIDTCANVTCYNGGMCSSTGTTFHCTCAQGFTGSLCEKLVDFCTPEPCHDNGRCVNTMKSYYCICRDGFYGEQCSLGADPDFSLSFNDRVSGYVDLPVWHVIHNVSVCLWMRSLDTTNYGTLLSYSAHSDWPSTTFSDAFTLYDYNDLQVIVNGQPVDTHMKLNDGYWHHICAVWRGDAGILRIYVNGTISGSALVAKDTHLEAPGRVIIGQRQLREFDRFFITRNQFIGDISQLNIYDRLLEENTIASLANKTLCTSGDGDVLAWTSVLHGVHGDLGLNAHCLDVNECLSPDICKEYEYCVDKTGGYECHPCPSAGCPGAPLLHDPCGSSPCLNGGTCLTHLNSHRCVCPLGFTGTDCELLVSTCSIMTCLNGGTCHEINDGVHCKCKPPWTGRYCHVMYQAKCAERPCLNGGTCQEHNVTGQYTCTCPSDGRDYGLNCELVTKCDSIPGPCIGGATCVVLVDGNITCLCPRDFEGTDCFYVSPATTKAPPIDYCHNVKCQNGGSCKNVAGGFKCSCPTDYKGLYCEKERRKETRQYDVSINLDMKYTPSLKQDEAFKKKVKQQVHNIYARTLKESTLKVEIVDIRPGSVQVDMVFHHTVYSDSSAPDPKTMEVILYNQLRNKSFGQMSASTANFKFNYQGELRTWVIYLLVSVAILALILSILVPWYVITKRRQRAKPEKLNNMPMCELNRVVNPAFEADSSPPTPRMRHLHEDNVYADLDPTPYAIDLCSGGKDSDPELNKRFPSKRGRDINKDWASWQRKAIPLPPKPGETTAGQGRENDGYLMPTKGTPPPSYKDVENKAEKYSEKNVNVDSEYIEPMSAYEERYGTDSERHHRQTEAQKDNISKARNLHVYINSPPERPTQTEQQPTYLPLLATPPANSQHQEAAEETGQIQNDDVLAGGESPDYLQLSRKDPSSAAPKPVIRDIKKGDGERSDPDVDRHSGSPAPEKDQSSDERKDGESESGEQNQQSGETNDGVSSDRGKRATIYAIGGDNND